MIDGGDALDAVVRHATDLDDDYDEIAPVLKELVGCADASLVPRLCEALDTFLDDQNVYGRDLVAGVLAGIAGMTALPVLLRASARDLGDDQDGLQTEIVGLLRTDRVGARPTVLEFAGSATPELRRQGLWALGFVVEAPDVDLLATAARDVDPRIRSIAIGSLPDPAGDDRAFGVLVAALSDPDKEVRAAAISRLGFTGRADAVEPLASAAGDRVPAVRFIAAYALGQLGRPEATDALLRLAQDPERSVREQAIHALGCVGSPAAVDALLAFAADPDPQSRIQVAKGLAQAADADPRVRSQIMTLVRDPEAAVRGAAIGGLAGSTGRPSDWTQVVVELAGDPDPAVRQRVAVTARRLAPAAARDVLGQLVSDRDENVRRVAHTELGRLSA